MQFPKINVYDKNFLKHITDMVLSDQMYLLCRSEGSFLPYPSLTQSTNCLIISLFDVNVLHLSEAEKNTYYTHIFK